MRPIRVTGVTGTSPPVILDVYAISPAMVVITGGAGPIEITASNLFDTAVTPQWHAPPAPAFVVGTPYVLPLGTRAVRANGLVAGDILEVSQQSIR